MAITQIRNEQIKDLTIELGKIKHGVELIQRDGSVAFTGNVNLNAHSIYNLVDPVNAQDAATKAYVDATAQGLYPKESARVVSLVGNIDLATGGLLTIDGKTLVTGDRVLVAAQTDATQNGIYVVQSGAWTRAIDADTSAKVKAGLFIFVTEGDVNQDSGWVLVTDNPITLGSTGLSFTQFSGAGQIDAGLGLTKSGNTLNVQTASSSRIVVNADNIDLATTGVAAGAYNVVTTDVYGRVSSAFLRTLSAGTVGLTINDGDGLVANPTISLSSNLVSLSNLASNGIMVRSANSIVTRTLQGTAGEIAISAGDGTTNPTLNLVNTGVAGTYNVVTTDVKGRVSSAHLRTLTSLSTGALTIANGDGVAADPTITVDADLVALAGISTTGMATRTAANTWTTRKIVVGSGLSIANADAVAGDPTISMVGSLSSLAALTDLGIVAQTAAGTVTSRTLISSTPALTIANADAIAGNPTFDLDADLTSIAAISTTGFGVRTADNTWTARSIGGSAGNVVVTNGDAVLSDVKVDLATVPDSAAGTFLKFTRDSYGRVTGTSPVTNADITSLVNVTYVNVTGDSMTGFLTLNADPAQPLHAVTKQYVDAIATGLDQKQSVRAATTANIVLSGEQTVDGVALKAGDRVLVKDQSVPVDNGIYVVATGAWLRSTDADNTPGNEVTSGMYTFIEEGTINGDNGWSLVTNIQFN